MVNGTLVWYYGICKRQVWFMGHGVFPDQDHDKIVLGRHIHNLFFNRFKIKEEFVDNVIRVDIVRDRNLIIEVKSSSASLESAKDQVLFYIYYLSKKGIEFEGEIRVPEERLIIHLKLDRDNKSRIEEIIRNIENIISMELPPKPIKVRYCNGCAYKEMCWV